MTDMLRVDHLKGGEVKGWSTSEVVPQDRPRKHSNREKVQGRMRTQSYGLSSPNEKKNKPKKIKNKKNRDRYVGEKVLQAVERLRCLSGMGFFPVSKEEFLGARIIGGYLGLDIGREKLSQESVVKEK